MEEHIEGFLDEHFWAVAAIVIVFIFKHTLSKFWSAFLFLHKGDYKEDDCVIINGRPGRIIRVGLWKTVFFLYDVDSEGKVSGGTKMVVQNEVLSSMQIEKQLMNLDMSRWKE